MRSARKTAVLTGLFFSFMFLQFTVLSLANHTGEGFLSETQREWVYYVIQVLVVLGFCLCPSVEAALPNA